MSVSFPSSTKPSVSTPSSPNNTSLTRPLPSASAPNAAAAVDDGRRQRRASDYSSYTSPDDPERQPLITAGELNQRKTGLPVLMGVVVFILLGFMIGFGGWRLGKGAGGDRWPGGPH